MFAFFRYYFFEIATHPGNDFADLDVCSALVVNQNVSVVKDTLGANEFKMLKSFFIPDTSPKHQQIKEIKNINFQSPNLTINFCTERVLPFFMIFESRLLFDTNISSLGNFC